MFLSRLNLQNFRRYTKKKFIFSKNITLVVGKNTSGKTNLIEAIYLLSLGKSFRTDKDLETISFGQNLARIVGIIKKDSEEEKKLELLILDGQLRDSKIPTKKYLVNGVGKRRIDFTGNFPVVLFHPEDLDIIIGSPGLRRRFLDNVLEQVDRQYSLALANYAKGIRQRNALLERVQETGVRNEKQFEYWNNLVIENGQFVTRKREEFINFINSVGKEIFDFVVIYDKSEISKERLEKYKEAEAGACVTLVGPHRDDFLVHMFNNTNQTTHDIKLYGSRGQQRLTILQLKLIELSFVEKLLNQRPTLLLDDIFSELDSKHIRLVLKIIDQQQTIITTTHKEFVDKEFLGKMDVIELKEDAI